MKLPDIDLAELKRFKKENFNERLKFIEFYVKWLKKTPNNKWSAQQKKLMD